MGQLGPSIGGKQYDYGYGSTDLIVLLLVRRPCGPRAPLVQYRELHSAAAGAPATAGTSESAAGAAAAAGTSEPAAGAAAAAGTSEPAAGAAAFAGAPRLDAASSSFLLSFRVLEP